jgi:hypothetical protein
VALAQLVALAAGAPGVGGARDPAKGLE